MTTANIPPLFHWIWLGRAPIPDEYRTWMESWTRRHPRWSTRMWTDSDVPALRNRNAFEQSPNWAQKSDVLRYEILLNHGGVYLDTDMECLCSLEPLLEGVEAFAGTEEVGGHIGSAILGATPGHPWMEAVVTALPESMAEHWLQVQKTGPGLLTRITAGRSDVKVFPPEAFYPYPCWGPRPPSPPAGAYAVHHYTNTWVDEELQRMERLFRREVTALVPAGKRLVVLGSWNGLELGHEWRTVPFLERDGVDWGAPVDDTEARAALADHRQRGTDVIVFLDTGRWWLETYPGLAADLRSTALSVHESPYLAAYWLTPRGTEPSA